MTFDLAAYLRERRRWVDDALDAYLPPAQQPPARLHEAMRYSLFCGGKRLRPILALAGAEAVGGEPHQVLPLACAVECIHTFSLIHDDLPAIDDDDLRRGSPTNHVVYGEAMAILAGDALLALAFELIAECRLFLPADRVLDALAMVARASGTRGMVGGQVSDIECEGRDDLDEADGRLDPRAQDGGAAAGVPAGWGASVRGDGRRGERPARVRASGRAWRSRSRTTSWTWKATPPNWASRSAAISAGQGDIPEGAGHPRLARPGPRRPPTPPSPPWPASTAGRPLRALAGYVVERES